MSLLDLWDTAVSLYFLLLPNYFVLEMINNTIVLITNCFTKYVLCVFYRLWHIHFEQCSFIAQWRTNILNVASVAPSHRHNSRLNVFKKLSHSLMTLVPEFLKVFFLQDFIYWYLFLVSNALLRYCIVVCIFTAHILCIKAWMSACLILLEVTGGICVWMC